MGMPSDQRNVTLKFPVSWFTVPCPVCQALNRDLARESELQAKDILAQLETGPDPQKQEAVLNSRKRQMKIASKLHGHTLLEHTA